MASTLLKIFIALLVLLCLFLLKKFQLQKQCFQNKEDKLVQLMQATKKKQIRLNAKVKLSEDFNQNYQKSRDEIAQRIYETNVQLFETIHDKTKTDNS